MASPVEPPSPTRPRAEGPWRHNLPAELTSFIGRAREIAEVARLLATTRLLTLTGAGGVGKTRLAHQVAAGLLDEYPDGVWLVELAALVDPSLVPRAVAATLGPPAGATPVREQPGRPLLEILADVLGREPTLLVLDNCEHLVDACAQLADTLLRACPGLRILATSRQPLGVAGETAWRVPSLALPEAGAPTRLTDLTAYEAVRLFVERARAVDPRFAVTEENAEALARICRHLDGIPLAIELAAARVNVLTVEEIAARLGDRFGLLTGGHRTALPRHRTLRALIDWSHDLLSEPERILLRRLSVFAGGFTLEAAEAVCAFGTGDGDASPSPVLDLLAQLVDKSLVLADMERDQARYCFAESLRQYGLEKLRKAGEEAALRDRHLAWCLAAAQQAEPGRWGSEQRVLLELLERELDNLRAALVWSRAEPGRAEAGLRLASALQWFWDLRGRLSEGRGWLMALLAVVPGRTAARARALLMAGLLAALQGDAVAVSHLEESLAISRELHDELGITWSLILLGMALHVQADDARAEAHREEGLGPGA